MMTGVIAALTNLEAALEREDPDAVELADRIGPMLWLLAGSPDLAPPTLAQPEEEEDA